MIRFRHYGPGNITPRIGILIDLEPRQPTLDLYIGRHVFVVFWDRH